MSKFRIVFYKGPAVTVEGEALRYQNDCHMLELLDSEGNVIAGFAQFSYWQKLEDAE